MIRPHIALKPAISSDTAAQILSGSGRIREGGLFHPVDEASKMSKG